MQAWGISTLLCVLPFMTDMRELPTTTWGAGEGEWRNEVATVQFDPNHREPPGAQSSYFVSVVNPAACHRDTAAPELTEEPGLLSQPGLHLLRRVNKLHSRSWRRSRESDLETKWLNDSSNSGAASFSTHLCEQGFLFEGWGLWCLWRRGKKVDSEEEVRLWEVRL